MHSRAGLIALLVAASALAVAHACGESHDGAQPSRWDLELPAYKGGRRRTLLSSTGRRCGTAAPDDEVLARVERRLAFRGAREAAFAPNARRQARVVTIPTYVFNVVSADGERGKVSEATIRAQVDVLNKMYATAVLAPDLQVSTSASQAGIVWQFDLKEIATVKAGDMCDAGAEKAVKREHRKGGKDALNLYFTDLSSCGLLGYSTWPWELDPKAGKADALVMDAVVIHHATMPGGSYKPYDMGMTTVHETGHWMGLLHVFQNGCTKSGDSVDDTPYQSAPTEGCPTTRDTCPQPGEDPFWNVLDYSNDACMKGLTALQHKRMESLWDLHRASG